MGDIRKKKLVLVEVLNRNMGDAVIADCTERLLRGKISKRGLPVNLIRYDIAAGDFGLLEEADGILFVGGGILKFRQEEFDRRIVEIVRFADEKQIPVFFNAVGVEGCDEGDGRCRELKAALRLPCVRGVTTRDDLRRLDGDYLCGTKIPRRLVYDPAVFSSEIFHVKRQPEAQTVGLGVIRDGVFADYGDDSFPREKQLAFWSGIAEELTKRGIPWKFYTNGVGRDEEFVDALAEHMGLSGENCRMPRPRSSEELIKMLSGFRGIIAGRMHSHIIAYSLGIPSVGVLWNDKLRMWSERIGEPEHYFAPADCDARRAVETLLRAKRKRLFLPRWQRHRLMQPAFRFLNGIVRAPEKKCGGDCPDFSKKLLAIAGGGDRRRYGNLNSAEILLANYKKGFRLFEIDMRLTTDGVPAAVNGWNDATFRRLGVSGEPKLGMDWETFRNARYYETYPTSGMEEIFSAAESCKGITLVLDIGKPGGEHLERFFAEIAALLAAHPKLKKRVIVRLQKRAHVSAAKKQLPGVPLAYSLEPLGEAPEEKLAEQLAFCGKHKITRLFVPREAFSAEAAKACGEAGIAPWVLSASGITQLKELWGMGASVVGTHYLDVTYVKQILE